MIDLLRCLCRNRLSNLAVRCSLGRCRPKRSIRETRSCELCFQNVWVLTRSSSLEIDYLASKIEDEGSFPIATWSSFVSGVICIIQIPTTHFHQSHPLIRNSNLPTGCCSIFFSNLETWCSDCPTLRPRPRRRV